MKKSLLLILIGIAMILILTSCNIDNLNTDEKISAPQNIKPPINGQWKVKEYKIRNGLSISKDDIDTIVKEKILFDDKIAKIGKEFCFEPSYKTKIVDSLDYLLYHYKVNPEYLDIMTKKIQIISVMSNEQFFCEVIKKDDKNIILNIDGVFFFLTKTSDALDGGKIEQYLEDREYEELSDSKDEEILRSGILLGLRYYDGESEKNQSWKYRTLWIQTHNSKLNKIYQIEDLFLPRKLGFWKIGMKRENIEGNLTDTIYAYPYNYETIEKGIGDGEKKESKKSVSNDNVIDKNSTKIIQYLGNDYIAIENIQNIPEGKKIFQVLPIDNIEKANPIKISDIAGESGKRAFYEGATKENADKSNYLNVKPDEENFSLIRRSGHWIMKGRVNYLDEENQVYADFDIKAISPEEIIGFDELLIPWNAIKLKVPEAIDAYTSPNEDIAIIVTHNYISIYSVKGNEIEELLAKVELNHKEQVIMAEWATGKYVHIWEEEFLKNDVSRVSVVE